MKRRLPRASVPSWMMLSWESQECQYPPFGPPGISYFKGPIDETVYVDCLLFRNQMGKLIGILNHYPIATVYEKVGNVNIWIHPHFQRRGVGTALFEEAQKRWGPFNLEQQRYSPEGAAMARKLLREGKVDGSG